MSLGNSSSWSSNVIFHVAQNTVILGNAFVASENVCLVSESREGKLLNRPVMLMDMFPDGGYCFPFLTLPSCSVLLCRVSMIGVFPHV